MELTDLPAQDYHDIVQQWSPGFMRACRHAAPLLRMTSPRIEENLLLVTDSADVMEVVGNPRIYASTGHPQALRFDSDFNPDAAKVYAADGCTLKNILVWSDGTDHSRVRKLVDRAFAPARIAAKSPAIQKLIDGLVDGFGEGGEIEFVALFSARLPTLVITHEFDLPPSEVDFVLDVLNKVSLMLDPVGALQTHVDAAPAVIRMQLLLRDKLANPKAITENTLLRHLATVEANDVPALTVEELLSLATLLLIAGSHTTGAMLAWSLFVLACKPELQQRLRAEPALVERFVEEVLRLHGPVPTSYRTATQDTELHGAKIPKGTWLLVRWDAINLDEARWDDPDTVDIDRVNVRRHSTFGHGAHFCIGNALGRREMVLAVTTMLRRFSRISLTMPADEVPLIPAFDIHMLMSLPLKLEV